MYTYSRNNQKSLSKRAARSILMGFAADFKSRFSESGKDLQHSLQKVELKQHQIWKVNPHKKQTKTHQALWSRGQIIVHASISQTLTLPTHFFHFSSMKLLPSSFECSCTLKPAPQQLRHHKIMMETEK